MHCSCALPACICSSDTYCNSYTGTHIPCTQIHCSIDGCGGEGCSCGIVCDGFNTPLPCGGADTDHCSCEGNGCDCPSVYRCNLVPAPYVPCGGVGACDCGGANCPCGNNLCLDDDGLPSNTWDICKGDCDWPIIYVFENVTFSGEDSPLDNFTVPAGASKIEVWLEMPGGADFDLSLWDNLDRRTGGWTSSEKERMDIPNSTYSGYLVSPEWIIVDNPTLGTWHAGCYAYSGSGTYKITVSLTFG